MKLNISQPWPKIDFFILLALLIGITFIVQRAYYFPRTAAFTVDNLPLSENLYATEQFPVTYQARLYRWTKGNAFFRLPNPGGNPKLKITLASASEQATPVRIRSKAHIPIASFSILPGLRSYSFMLPHEEAAFLNLWVESPTMREKGGRREIGIIVSDLAISGDGTAPEHFLAVIVFLTLIVYSLMRQLQLNRGLVASFLLIFQGIISIWQGIWGWNLVTPPTSQIILIGGLSLGLGWLSLTIWQKRALLQRLKVIECVGLSASAILTLLPILHIIFILATTGADNPSSDDFVILAFLGPILDGTYDWQRFFREVFYNTHFIFFTSLIYIAMAYLTHLNIYSLLWLGVLFSIFKVYFLYASFIRFQKNFVGQGIMLPLIAALTFSTSQISLFEHGVTAIGVNLGQLAVTIGIWGLVRWPNQWAAIGIMLTGGIVASWTTASGLIAWPAFLVGMLILNFRRLLHYAVWLGGAILSAIPYIIFLVFLRIPGDSSVKSLGNYQILLPLIGLPLANNTFAQNVFPAEANLAGAVGIALGLTGFLLLGCRKRWFLLQASAPTIMLMIHGFLNLCIVSVFRGGLLPWYTYMGMSLWVGLVGLIYILWSDNQFKERAKPKSSFQKALSLSVPFWSAGAVLAIVILYLGSNISYRDKSVFLGTRSPASASCIRNYREAPVYCENTLVIWDPGSTNYIKHLASPLERHQLSTFAPRQQWALQGDFILQKVQIHEAPAIPDIQWTPDLTLSPTPWSDYRHLNLVLHAPNSIDWTITLPKNVKQATFHSAVALSTATVDKFEADGVTFEITVSSANQADQILFRQHLAPDQHAWQPFSFPLHSFAGQTITLHLASNPGANPAQDWGLYRYPFIDVVLDTAKPSYPEANAAKAPTFMPQKTNEDFVFEVANPNIWKQTEIKPITGTQGISKTWKVLGLPSLTFKQNLDLRLADYSYFFIEMGFPEIVYPRALQIVYTLNNQTQNTLIIPLYDGNEINGYAYDLKLLELNQNARLRKIEIKPIYRATPGAKNLVQITDFRLIHKKATD